MSNRKTPPATRYRITFTVRDGDNEYADWLTDEWDTEPSADEAAEYVIREHGFSMYDGHDDDRPGARFIKRALKEYKQHGFFTLSGDYRIVKDFRVRLDPEAVLQQLLEAAKTAADILASLCSDNRSDHGEEAAFNKLTAAIANAERA
jgi:hypothetical protein